VVKRFINPGWWATHWPNALLYLAITAVFVFTVNQASDLRESDVKAARDRSEQIRDSNLRFCMSSNERTALLREFVLSVTQDPDPRQYDYIADPKLRQGVLDQARRSRAATRERVDKTFTQRDCERDYPPLPPVNGN
jgi:hypothetical protein